MLDKGISIDRFKIDRPISNKGGTATVYLAHVNDSPKMKVAIKIANTLSGQPTPEDVLLRREGELLSRWDWRHSGIIHIYPANQKDYVIKALNLKNEPLYMVMEYLTGETLSSNSSKIKDFPLGWKLELFYNIICSVAFLHQKGYAHRDLKPENIVFRRPITPYDPPQPVLIDFALAWNGTDDIDYVKSSYTLAYASPERILSSMGYEYEGSLLASDIWSLGIILYEIITGENLLKGNADQIRTTIVEARLKLELTAFDERNELLIKIIGGMLEKNPADRPRIDQIIKLFEVYLPPPRIAQAN